jgi:transcriptional regulator with XRE-family HTH domain
MESSKKIFPTALRNARIAKGLSQEELGKLIDVTKQTISRYESGLIEPGIGIVVKLAKTLEVSIDELTGIKPPVISFPKIEILDPQMLKNLQRFSEHLSLLDNKSIKMLLDLAKKLADISKLK